MAKDGYSILDSDIHVMEPPDMFDRYLDPELRVYTASGGSVDLVTEPPDAGKPGFEANRQKMLRAQAVLSARVQDRYIEEQMRGYTPELLLEAMDREGVDVAVLFRSRSHMYVDRDDLDAEYATAICRAYNDWLADFAKADPSRMLASAIVTLHDPGLAAIEARRAVGELGMRAVTLLPHPVRGRYLHDPEVDVLWSALQELDVPATFHSQSGGYAIESPGNWFRDHPNPYGAVPHLHRAAQHHVGHRLGNPGGRARALSRAAHGVPGGQLRLAALAAVAARRAVGAVRGRGGDTARPEALRVLPAPMLHLGRSGRGAGVAGDR